VWSWSYREDLTDERDDGSSILMVFHIQPHVRLHEWVAEERGFFHAEGLDYQFDSAGFAAGSVSRAIGFCPGAVVKPAR